MPIIRDLRKDFDEGRMDKLRSLKYEDSGTKAPYVTKQKGDPTDGISRRVDDLYRITQMLVDKPGLKHLSNEALLKQEELTRKLQGNDKTAVGNIIRRVGGTVKHVAQVAGSTLAQVPVNGTGTHFLRGFRTDTYIQEGDTSGLFGTAGVEGSQYALRGKRVPSQGLLSKSILPGRNTTANRGDLGKYHVGIEGDLVTEDNSITYTSDSTYTKTDTLDNVNNIKNSQSVSKPVDLLRNTSPSPGSLGVDKKDVIGDVPENVFVTQGNYRTDTPYTETVTVTNIVNANNGNPINNPAGTGQFDQTFAVQTTSLEGTFGISNKAIEGDISDTLPERSQIITFNNGQLEAGGGRTASSTKDNINRSRVGARIPLLGAPTRPSDDLSQKGITTLFNLEDGKFRDYITSGNAPVEDRKKLIDLNTGEDGIGIGTITSLPKQFEQKFIDVEGARYLDSTENNSIAAQVGVPINNENLYGNSPIFNTTDLKGNPVYGKSIENRGVLGDITELDPKFDNKYNDGESNVSYIVNTTLGNINAAQSGTPITNKSVAGPTPVLNTTLKKGDIPNSTSNKGIAGDITELNPKFENKYRDGNAYTEFDTKGNIDSVQSGEVFGAGGSIPLRDNTNFDGLNGSSPTIEQAKEDPNQYNGQLGPTSIDSGKQIQDFRSKEADNNFSDGLGVTYSFDYNKTEINKETRVKLGNQGYRKSLNISYNDPTPDLAIDKINALDVKRSPLDAIKDSRDLIQLEFQVMTPEDTYYLAFRAFLDTFDDSFTGSWNTNKYLGRADNFYTYSGFERSINIGFKIAAATKEEMKPLYRKAATLASVTAPTYGDNGRFMRGSLAKVTVGDYIYEQPGIIESVQYTWQKDYPWEISFQNPENKDGKGPQILPHVLDVSITFKVIHDFLPQTGITPLITNYKADRKTKKVYIDLPEPEVVKAETEKETEVKKAKENKPVIITPPVSSELEGNPFTFPFANN